MNGARRTVFPTFVPDQYHLLTPPSGTYLRIAYHCFFLLKARERDCLPDRRSDGRVAIHEHDWLGISERPNSFRACTLNIATINCGLTLCSLILSPRYTLSERVYLMIGVTEKSKPCRSHRSQTIWVTRLCAYLTVFL